MKDYFYLQYLMTNRKLKEMGVHPGLGYVLGLVTFVLISEYIFEKTTFAKYWVVLTGVSLLIKLSEKSRTDFLSTTFGDDRKRTIRVLENLILSAPFMAILFYKGAFVEGGAILAIAVIMAAFSFQRHFNFSIPTPFSKRPFEFLVGFRKTFFIFPIAYTLTAIAIEVGNLNLGIFSMLLIFLTALSYFTKPEHEYYVWIYAETPQRFLKNKMIMATKNTFLLVAPILIGLCTFYPMEYQVILLFFVVGLLFLWTIILGNTPHIRER